MPWQTRKDGLAMNPLSKVRVDRSSPVPLYHQVAVGIEELIRAGELPVGSWLDNEIELASQFGLSRPTMRRAIAELVDGGLLVRQRGVGTRVVNSHIARPVVLSSLYDDLADSGAEPTTSVLSLHQVSPTGELADIFPPGEELWELRRLRSTNNGPLALMHNWVPVTVVTLTEEALSESGLYELMRRSGASFRTARQQIGACTVSGKDAELLGIADGSACVTMRRLTYNGAGDLLEVGEHLYRADLYHFESTVVAR